MKRKQDCIVVTYFVDNQPGYLDFLYRVRSLSKHYNLILVSRSPLDHPEWNDIPGQRVVLQRSESRKDWFRYQFDCAGLIKRHADARVVLLASTVAPVALLIGKRPVALYWNEDPVHFSPDPADGSAPKKLIRQLTRWAMFAGARRAATVMPIGEAHWDDLHAHGVAADRMQMVYMGVDAGFIAAGGAPRDDGPIRLIYVGTVAESRGRDVMLDGLADALRHGVQAHLTLVGADEEQRALCVARAARLGIASHVTVLGRIPGTEIPRYLGHADAGVCLVEDKPIWRVNPPTKLFEYLVAGLPVLASDIRTHTAYLQNGHDGFTFPYSAEGFSQGLQQLHACRADLGVLRAQAVKSGEKFVWNKLESNFLAVVDRLERVA